MTIKMYNCQFGDCFQIMSTSGRNLFVDFGGRNDQAIKDISEDSAFLLTHFHEDHFKNAMNIGARDNKFKEVYIPDVWDVQTCTDVVALLLMDSKINRKMSVMDFMLKICEVNSGIINFVQRGCQIEKHFVALWPCHCCLAARAGEIMMDMHSNIKICVDERLESRFDFEQVGAIASRLIQTVSSYADSPQAYAFQKELQELKREYDKIRAFPKNKMVGYQLSNFGNLISIVFQNALPCEQNVLFLGDFGKPKRLWKMIEGNCGGMVGMHNTYSDIKIPHHGTKCYYHSFVKYFSQNEGQPTTVYIPNGCHQHATWQIDERYSIDANGSPGAISNCSNNDACNAAMPICQCQRRNIVHPRDAI